MSSYFFRRNSPGQVLRHGASILGLSLCCSIVSVSLSPVFAQEAPTATPPETAKQGEEPQIDLPKAHEGEADLEEASRLRLNVDSLETLREIIVLAKSAIDKGLDEADKETAKKMIAACLVQKTEETQRALRNARQIPRSKLSKLINEFAADLDEAIEMDPTLPEAYLLKVELDAGRNEVEKAFEVADRGVKELTKYLDGQRGDLETREKLSRLMMMRAGLRTETAEILDDLKLALKTNPNNVAGMALLRETLIRENRYEEAVTFFKSLLETTPDNQLLLINVAELLALEDGTRNEGLQLLDREIKQHPESVELYRTRAKIRAVNKETELAKEDMDKVLELSKNDLDGLIFRARVELQADNAEAALKDIEAALEIDPNHQGALLLRSLVARTQQRYADAIEDMQTLIKMQPKDAQIKPEILLDLGFLYSLDNRPTQAIKIFNQIIKMDGENWEAYRARGDTRLSTQEHHEAVADLENALKYVPDDATEKSGILNNLSWVLSTSPIDEVRDGKRALELGLQACELTKYERPHILSTLAAAYAETGDFDQAVHWSTKAVELGRETDEPQLDQLESELENYKNKKPWREEKKVKENRAPIGDSGIDT